MSAEQELEQAWELLERGDIAAARRIGKALADKAEEAADTALLLAACAREEADVDGALALLAQAVEADPEWAIPEIWMAELLAPDPERLDEALRHATRALEVSDEEDEFLEAVALKAGLEIDLGKLAAARKTLAELPPLEAGELPVELALEFAHLHLASGDDGEARRRFQALVDGDPSFADAWYGVGLAAEAQDDEDGKRAAWLEVLALDERTTLDDAQLTEGEMAEVAEAALAELPPKARTLIENVPIMITELPSKQDVQTGMDPRLLGLFSGSSYPDTPSVGGTPQLTQILLFRKNLERIASDRDQLREEVRTTLLHETGHFFGMDEEDLAGVGLD